MQTILPRVYLEKLFDQLPELKAAISYAFCLEDLLQSEIYILKDIGCLLQDSGTDFPRTYETLLIANVQGQALVDDRYLFSIVASKSYDGGLYFAQLSYIH